MKLERDSKARLVTRQSLDCWLSEGADNQELIALVSVLYYRIQNMEGVQTQLLDIGERPILVASWESFEYVLGPSPDPAGS